ncbi:MAG: serine/threonine protein kinase [Myxococcales bacterium]|nr:serine/threonine protein kinase [Myxococcales bacterium]
MSQVHTTEAGSSSSSVRRDGPFRKGQVIDGRYRVAKVLGEGGIGVVYQVEHVLTGKVMALKMLHNHLLRGRNAAAQTFRQEIHQLARLSHPHAMELFDCGTLEGELYLVMEYLPGLDLEKLLQTQVHLPWTMVLKIGEQACGALQHAHAMGLFHRNLKPANVMLLHYQGEEDFVKLLDFGLTTSIEAAQHQGEERTFFGDLHYTAPEHRSGMRRPDASADIYSLAAILYEMTVRRPYWKDLEEGKTFAMPGVDAQLLKPLLDVLRAALDEDTKKRPSSAEEFLQKLLAAQEAILSQETQGAAEDEPPKAFEMPTPPKELPSPREVMSRKEWERVERLWKWRARSRWIALFLLVLGGIGWFTYRSNQTAKQQKREAVLAKQIYTQEREPNNNALQATKIGLNTWVQGELGKPQADMRSDHDWYSFRLTEKEQLVSIRLIPPKLLDIELGVYQLVKGKPGRLRTEVHHIEVLKSNNGQRGEEESIPATRLYAGEYFLLVRELTVIGEKPQPNLGPYRLIVEIKKPKPQHELEPNDTVAKASVGGLHKTFTGLHDHPRDLDFFSFSLPSYAEVAKRWKDCKDCPKRSRRWSYYRTVFKDAPIYLLRVYTVPKVQANISLLNAKIQPIMMLDQQFQGLPKKYKKKRPKKGVPAGPEFQQFLFTGEGPHYLRIETKDGHHYTKPYRWKIIELPLR